MNQPGLSFVHISDTHLGPARDFLLYGKNTCTWASRIVEAINGLDARVDFVVHGGDVVNRVYAEALALAHQVFAPLKYPLYYVPGNHDTTSAIRSLMAGRKDLTALADDEGVCYWFRAGGYRCLVLDTRGPATIDPHGSFDDSRCRILAQFLTDAGAEPVLIFVHFPPLPLDSKWHNRDMLMLNGERFHETIVTSGAQVLGVFFGHVHRHVTVVQDGILYSGAPSGFCQFGALPNDQTPRFEHDASPGIIYVTVTGTRVIVREFRFGEGSIDGGIARAPRIVDEE